jgi:hypothetical protein
VSPVKYELGFYIPEDNILHSDRRESLKSYVIGFFFRNSFGALPSGRAVEDVAKSLTPIAVHVNSWASRHVTVLFCACQVGPLRVHA